jgi:hypothetical protein
MRALGAKRERFRSLYEVYVAVQKSRKSAVGKISELSLILLPYFTTFCFQSVSKRGRRFCGAPKAPILTRPTLWLIYRSNPAPTKNPIKTEI